MSGDLFRGKHPQAKNLDATRVALELYRCQLGSRDVERPQERGQPGERNLMVEIGAEPEDDLVAGPERLRIRIEIFFIAHGNTEKLAPVRLPSLRP